MLQQSTPRRLVLAASALIGVTVGLASAQPAPADAGALIKGSQVRDGSVTGADLRDGAITGAHVADGSLRVSDYVPLPPAARGRAASGIAPGPVGPQGPPGPAGEPGRKGLPGIHTAFTHTSEDVSVPAGAIGPTLTASCPPGRKVTGGGIEGASDPDVVVLVSAPLDEGAGWAAAIRNDDSTSAVVRAWAVCVTAY